ncbi:hypothetical protein D9M71_534050 [compost metagenome]
MFGVSAAAHRDQSDQCLGLRHVLQFFPHGDSGGGLPAHAPDHFRHVVSVGHRSLVFLGEPDQGNHCVGGGVEHFAQRLDAQISRRILSLGSDLRRADPALLDSVFTVLGRRLRDEEVRLAPHFLPDAVPVLPGGRHGDPGGARVSGVVDSRQ